MVSGFAQGQQSTLSPKPDGLEAREVSRRVSQGSNEKMNTSLRGQIKCTQITDYVCVTVIGAINDKKCLFFSQQC